MSSMVRRGNVLRIISPAGWLLILQFFFLASFSQPGNDRIRTDIFLSGSYGYPTFRQTFPFDQTAYGFNNIGYTFLRSEWKRQDKSSSFGLTIFTGFRNYPYAVYNHGSGTVMSGQGLGFRYSYYFRSTETFHFYGTVGGGLQREDYPYADVYGEIYLGVKVRLYKKLWCFGEAGVGKALAQAGLCLKFENVRGAMATREDSVEVAKKQARRFDTTEKRSVDLSVGYGIPNFLSAFWMLTSSEGSDYIVVRDHGAFLLRGEKYLSKEKMTVGATVYYSSQQIEIHHRSHHSYSTDIAYYQDLGAGVRTNLFFVRKPGFHSYLGLGFGARIPLRDKNAAPVYGELVAGFRFMLGPDAGLFFEIGPSKVLVQGGITIKL